jgi:magnesium transporter
MTSQITLYLSHLIGRNLYQVDGSVIGKIKDIVVDISAADVSQSVRPKVIAVLIKSKGKKKYIDAISLKVYKVGFRYDIIVENPVYIQLNLIENMILLVEDVMDKQLVDINGRKLVRVNDVRLVSIDQGIFAIAVDVGMEGLLRRLGVVFPLKKLLNALNLTMPSKFILWDDVEAVDFSTSRITLSKPFSKLHELHPSDLADIIEDLGKATRTDIFSSLDDEKAADVLEELEVSAQIDIIERLPLDKAADVLELMPADEVADILDELDKDRAELLLNEMEKEASEEVRELLEYEDNEVGSIMTTDFLILKEEMSIEESLLEIRAQKPEADMIYSLYVTDKKDRLISSVSLRDLVVSEPSIRIRSIMKRNPVKVFDDDKIDSLAEIISKYNLLAIPVTDREHKLQGMVVIDDIVEDLLDKRKTK